MKKLKLKEYYGTQRPSFAGGPGAGSNFYSGKDLGVHSKGSLGTRGADSNFSRIVMQRLAPEYIQEEIEEIDEDVEVENSRYSLKEILRLLEAVEMIDNDGSSLGWADDDDGNFEPPDPPNSDSKPFRDPDPDDENLNLLALTKSEESVLDIAGDVLLDTKPGSLGRSVRNLNTLLKAGGKTGAKGIPGLGETISVIDMFSSYRNCINAADKLIEIHNDLKQKFKKEPISMMLQEKETYQRRLVSAIKEVEKLQAEIYENIGEFAENIIELFPLEYFCGAAGAAVGGLAGTPTGPGAAATAGAGGILSTLACDYLESVIGAGLGEGLERLVKEFVEMHEVNQDSEFKTWIKNGKSKESIALKVMIFMTSILEVIPGTSLLSYLPFVGGLFGWNKIFNGVLKGARIQSELVFKVTQLQNPDLIPREEIEQSDDLRRMRSSASDAISGLFFRPSGSGSSNPLTRNLFETSLENRSLLYLIEEKDTELEDEDVNEMSAGGVAGVAVPLGRNPDGSKTTKRQIKKQYDFFNKTYGRR